nr:Chain A, GUANYLIN PRECURSOR [Homo sapiens]1GNB_A Chain A, GUANYLIN PRECURSOR [Homo sapiens]
TCEICAYAACTGC